MSELKHASTRRELVERQREAFQEFRPGGLRARGLGVKVIGIRHQCEHLDRARFQVHDPVFGDAKLFVQRLLVNAVAPPASLRKHLDHEVRHAADAILNDALFRLGDVNHVGLDRAVGTEHDVERCEEDLAQLARRNELIHRLPNAGNDLLMFRMRSR